jgi:site-specific recombinase XerD
LHDKDLTMARAELPTATTISVFTRHSGDCQQRDNPQWRRCQCRKSLYIREGGKTQYLSAKTRSWESAERVAQAERDRRDPVKLELQRIAELEAIKEASAQAKLKPLAEALDQWLSGLKTQEATSKSEYRSTTRKILRWADKVGIVHVSDTTPALLDAWRASWSIDSTDAELRIALTSQSALLTRIKSFYRWATSMEYIHRSPAQMLKSVSPGESKTWPLTPSQFEELLLATDLLDLRATKEAGKVGRHLRAIFLVQRWTGLRIGDVVSLPKSALRGNRLTATIRKKRKRKPTACQMDCILPDHVIAALQAIPLRTREHPDYFCWGGRVSEVVNTSAWIRRIDELSKHLNFKDENGGPLDFRSHMLRDTFAVEMLLAGVPLEKVSKLLGHESVTVTERYYAKWTASRRLQLEDEAVAAMRKMGAMFS